MNVLRVPLNCLSELDTLLNQCRQGKDLFTFSSSEISGPLYGDVNTVLYFSRERTRALNSVITGLASLVSKDILVISAHLTSFFPFPKAEVICNHT